MVRNAMYVLLVVLGFTMLATHSEAQLGCLINGGPPVAICGEASDCAPVGGVDCTGGACFCPDGALSPFCACAVAPPPAPEPAPALSPAGLVAVAGLLCAVGMLGMWRRKSGRRAAS